MRLAATIIFAGEWTRYRPAEAGIISMAVINNAPTVFKRSPIDSPKASAKPILMRVVGVPSLFARSSLMKVVRRGRQKKTVRLIIPRAVRLAKRISCQVRARMSPNKNPVNEIGGCFMRDKATSPRAKLPWEKIARIESTETFDLKGIRVRAMARPTQKRIRIS